MFRCIAQKNRSMLLLKSSKHSRQIEINGYILNNLLMYFPLIGKFSEMLKFPNAPRFTKGCLCWEKSYRTKGNNFTLGMCSLPKTNAYILNWTNPSLYNVSRHLLFRWFLTPIVSFTLGKYPSMFDINIGIHFYC